MRSEVAIVGVGRTPYSRAKPGEPVRTVDEYLAWAADLALQQAGMSKNDFDGQGLGVAHAEVAHTVNWSAAVAEVLGISPQVLLRADQGGASASALLIRAAAMIHAGIVDRVLVVGADTPLNMPSVAPGLPLSPERTRGVFWDFQGPFGVMGASAQFALVYSRYLHEYGVTPEQMAKVAVNARYHAGLHEGAIYRKPITVQEYLDSRVLTDPIRLLDCVPIVNGGLAYVVTSAKTARTLTDRPVYLRASARPTTTTTARARGPTSRTPASCRPRPRRCRWRACTHQDVQFFQPYDDYPFVAMMTIEDHGFCRKGEGGRFVEDHDLHFDGDFPMSTDGGQLSGGQPGGAIGGFMPLVESVTQLRGEAGARQVRDARLGISCGFGGIPYGRPGRSCVSRAVHGALKMAESAQGKPLPTITDLTRPFWTAAKQGHLVLQKCQRCATFNFHPKPWCIECGSRELVWTDAQPTGTVYSHTISRYGGDELSRLAGRAAGADVPDRPGRRPAAVCPGQALQARRPAHRHARAGLLRGHQRRRRHPEVQAADDMTA
jgi:acetyl-CoA acetyltransferase